ncbi:uncharacterized protein LOC131620052 [Vicia villosa]|uniref:uncharacterized protein LOC131620052 n=1 Tax=Vicia villosa TaxID=3911 RepID=UPI00273C37DC|nr:uncharacterized protein LOC131620052 [Vicia villosa]
MTATAEARWYTAAAAAVKRFELWETKWGRRNGRLPTIVNISSMSCHSGGFPVSVSNTWNGMKLLINDISIDEVKNLKERIIVSTCFILGDDLSLLSSSSVQETTYVTAATLDKLEARQMGWYYDGCVECTRSVTVKDGNLKCYKEHISSKHVPRYSLYPFSISIWYKLDVTTVDGKSKVKFVFWDTDCVKLIGKSALQMKMDLIQTSKLHAPNSLSQDDMISISEPIFASAESDPLNENSGLTPSKRFLSDAVEDVDSVQQPSTKLAKDIKKE